MKKIIILTILLSACSSQKMIKYTVETNPTDATIDVNGTNLCTGTPCEIQLECNRQFVGVLNGGYRGSTVYTVEAFPRASGLFSQRKVIDACQVNSESGGRIYMDLKLERLNPRNTVDVNVR